MKIGVGTPSKISSSVCAAFSSSPVPSPSSCQPIQSTHRRKREEPERMYRGGKPVPGRDRFGCWRFCDFSSGNFSFSSHDDTYLHARLRPRSLPAITVHKSPLRTQPTDTNKKAHRMESNSQGSVWSWSEWEPWSSRERFADRA